MKSLTKILLLVVFSIRTTSSFSQTLEGYFISKGVYHLCQAAHASNDYLEGTYDINKGYVDISLKSKDNVFGASIHTDLRLFRGNGDLYFSDITVLKDDDMVNPFDAFGLQIELMRILIQAVDKETYNKMRNSIKNSFNTDFENWTGKMWALLAINLDYYEYMLTGK